MTQSLYEQLVAMTVVVADTGDLESIARLRPRDATTNPSLVLAAARSPQYAHLLDAALEWAEQQVGPSPAAEAVVAAAADRLCIELGLRILELVPGRVSTEVDARLSHDTAATVERARRLIRQYEAAGASRERVLIKIAATWEGIEAARELEAEGIHCNVTLVFGLHQAAACAEVGVTLISPFVGRILDWHRAREPQRTFLPAEDPGVQSVRRIYDYVKRIGSPMEVMGASFRNLGQITELAGCDLLTIAPNFLEDLRSTHEPLPRKLDPERVGTEPFRRLDLDRTAFDRMHAEDAMASDKLDEGIRGFCGAIETLEGLLAERLEAGRGRSDRVDRSEPSPRPASA